MRITSAEVIWFASLTAHLTGGNQFPPRAPYALRGDRNGNYCVQRRFRRGKQRGIAFLP